MKQNKTVASTASVADYLATITPASRQADCVALVALLQQASGYPPVMWGDSIVGFGCYQYRYDSGRRGEMCLVGFSSRKSAISLYILPCVADPRLPPLLQQLGKFKQAVSCLSVQRLSDINSAVLQTLVQVSIAITRQQYPS